MQRPGPGMREMKMDLQYQNVIPAPPMPTEHLYKAATSGDGVTVESWRKIWIDQYRLAKERFGDLGAMSIGLLAGSERHRPCIAIGSGPSLKHSISALQENQALAKPIPTVSCLHNYAFLRNNGIKVDYWLSLDSGEVVIDDATETGKEGVDYWATTENETLVCNITSHPKLFDKWKGKVRLFNCLVPDKQYREETDKIEVFKHYISSGGNAGGACAYFGKVVLGCNPIVFVGMDFCFDYANEFHSYQSKYDNWNGGGLGNYQIATDVFGNSRKTYPSYYNFKCYLDYVACSIPGTWISCSEGLLGAYKEGNIAQYEYMPLKAFILQHKMTEHIGYEFKDATGKATSLENINLNEMWKDSKYSKDIVLY